MINSQDIQEKEHIETIRDSPKNKSRVTIEYQFDIDKDILGTGGYGEVYKVKKKRSNMVQDDPDYALKIFNKVNFYKDNDKGSRILTEIKIHRSLNHEHIVKYEHSFEDKKNVYILMEYCHNGTLATLLKTRKYLEEYEIRYYMFQVLSVLKYFRREKIVHRDLTLGNIFLKDIKTVKIGDFGFAYKESENDEKSGIICGTPGYFTPESNNSKYSYKTDIFDFGLCIYYLFGGKPLFKTSLESIEFFSNKESLVFDKKLKFSEEAINLLNQIITLENQRIDLDKIYKHPFFNSGKGLSKDKFPEYNENNKPQFLKELSELPKNLGLILTPRNKVMYNQFNATLEPSNGIKVTNDLRNNFSPQSGKNVSFNLIENSNVGRFKLTNTHLRNTTKIKDRLKDKEKENSKNSGDLLENLTKTIITKKEQNKIKDLINNNNTENTNNLNNNNLNNNIINSNINEDKKINKVKSNDNNNNFLYNLTAVIYENENENNKYKNRNLIYIDNIIDNYIEYCGIGFQLSNKSIGVYFNDNTQLLKIDSANNYLLYFSKGFKRNNSFVKSVIELNRKNNISNNMNKKIKFLTKIMENFIKKDKDKISKNEKETILDNDNIYIEDEDIHIEKYRLYKKISLFILSNKNIQVNFIDKTKILFICDGPKEIVYINQNEKIYLQVHKNNFNNFNCENSEITKKINVAIKFINK